VDWLLAAFQVDNREAPHTQARWPLEVEAIVVRSPMPDGSAHPLDQLLVHITTVATNYACDSTHNAHLLTWDYATLRNNVSPDPRCLYGFR